MLKRNCNNCRYLEWFEGEDSDPKGWICNRGVPYKSAKHEGKHLEQLSSSSYRQKSKRCFEHYDNMENL
jgi:hypothetical protein